MCRLCNTFKKHFMMIPTKNRKKNHIWNSFNNLWLRSASHSPDSVRMKEKVSWLCPCLDSLVYSLNFEWFPLLCFNQSMHTEHRCFFSSLILHVIFFLPPVHGFLSWGLWYLVNNLTHLLTDQTRCNLSKCTASSFVCTTAIPFSAD